MAVAEPQPEHGYWSVAIYPLPRVEGRFAPAQLIDRLGEASVALRGWNYPHISRHEEDFTYRGEWLEGRTSWERYQEVWRFHTDGLFIHRWRMREDGSSYRGTIHFVAAIYTVAEVWEFARRLYGQDESVESVRVRLELDNVGGRQGSGDSFEDLPYGVQARQNKFQYEATVRRLDLWANPRGAAVEMTTRLFRELGFGISEAFIDRRTDDFLAGRSQ
jgi:hypothetical protein